MVPKSPISTLESQHKIQNSMNNYLAHKPPNIKDWIKFQQQIIERIQAQNINYEILETPLFLKKTPQTKHPPNLYLFLIKSHSHWIRFQQ
jgi:hypothetical protein